MADTYVDTYKTVFYKSVCRYTQRETRILQVPMERENRHQRTKESVCVCFVDCLWAQMGHLVSSRLEET